MAWPPIDLSLPRWDQSTYWGRARHFFTITNPANLWVTSARLAAARDTVTRYKRGELNHLTEEEVWRAKQLYDSAFHPETGEKMPVAGRMAAQVPCSALIVGCMLTWHKTVPAVVFWQLANQSFNALVNYTNRSGDSPPPLSTLAVSYAAATGSALATALTLNSLVHSLPPLAGRLVPFLAVTAGNCINIPLMRRTELSEGVLVKTEEGLEVGHSKVAARRAIAMVVLSRVAMAVPGMVFIPIIMNSLDRRGMIKKIPWANAPLHIGLLGLVKTFAMPLCCAIFQQNASIRTQALEQELRDNMTRLGEGPSLLYYNKGL